MHEDVGRRQRTGSVVVGCGRTGCGSAWKLGVSSSIRPYADQIERTNRWPKTLASLAEPGPALRASEESGCPSMSSVTRQDSVPAIAAGAATAPRVAPRRVEPTRTRLACSLRKSSSRRTLSASSSIPLTRSKSSSNLCTKAEASRTARRSRGKRAATSGRRTLTATARPRRGVGHHQRRGDGGASRAACTCATLALPSGASTQSTSMPRPSSRSAISRASSPAIGETASQSRESATHHWSGTRSGRPEKN